MKAEEGQINDGGRKQHSRFNIQQKSVQMEEEGDSKPVTVVAFKKRAPKGQIRRADPANVAIKREDGGSGSDNDNAAAGDDDGEEGGADVRTLADIRLEQEMRRRKTKAGVDAATALSAQRDARHSKHGHDSTTVIGGPLQQRAYTSHVDHGIGAAAPHKHVEIMEAYVRSKLSAAPGAATANTSNGSDSNGPAMSAEGGLYALSDGLRAPVSVEGEGADKDPDDASIGNFTGLAEVQLPSSYAIRAAQETERTRQMLAEKGASKKYDATGLRTQLGYRSMQGGYNGTSDRFAKPISHKEFLLIEEKKVERSGVIAAPTVPLPGQELWSPAAAGAGAGVGGKRAFSSTGGGGGGGSGGGSGGSGGHHSSSGGGMATDKRVMDEYRKKMVKRR